MVPPEILLGAVVLAADPSWTAVLDRYGLPLAALAVVFVGGAKYLVPGWVHQRALADLDRERLRFVVVGG